MSTVREVAHDLMRAFGMTTVFGNPGSTELPFLQDFPDDFRYILGLQEASALGMAAGYAQALGRAALVNLHTAPGLGNAMGAMVTAYENKIPLLVTAGQQDRRHIALEPLLTGRLVELARPYVKRSYEPLRAQDVPHEIQRAYHTAMQQPSGPVFLSIPMDDWGAEVEPPAVRAVSHRTLPDPAGLRETAELLKGAKKPAMVTGPGVARTGTFADVLALAEKLRAEVWNEPVCALAGFPQDHPLFRGYLTFAQKQVAEELSPYDVVLVLGAPVFTYYPYVPGPVVESGTRVVQITEDPQEAARAPIGTSIVGDLGSAMQNLSRLLPQPTRAKPAAREHPPAPEATTPMSVDYVMHTISEALPDDVIIVDESTSSKTKLHRYIRINDPVGYHTSAAGGLGFCMPAAVGVKLARPERPVVCVIGDGSSMYSIQALWSAVRYGAEVTFVVINNRGYSILKSFRDVIGAGDRVPGLDLPGVDLPRIARGFGVEASAVENADALPQALKRALNFGGSYLLDVIVDPAVPAQPR